MRAAVLLLLDSSSSRKIDNRSRAIQQQQHQKTETAEDWAEKAKRRSTKKILCRSVEQIRNHTLGGRVAKVFNCAIVNVNGQLQPPYPTPSSALASIKQTHTHTLTHSLLTRLGGIKTGLVVITALMVVLVQPPNWCKDQRENCCFRASPIVTRLLQQNQRVSRIRARSLLACVHSSSSNKRSCSLLTSY